MSRLWRDEIRIALLPDRVALARVSRRRLRPQIIAKHVAHCSATAVPAGSVQGMPPGFTSWQPCVAAMQQMLQQPFARDADATVVISNHFVRYALVPWSEHLVRDDEKRAWIGHHFVALYGEPAAACEYRWSDDSPAAACVASAADGGFIGAIRAAFELTSLRLRSVQPYLMAVFNRWKRHVKGNPVWLLVPETGCVCIASAAGGQWRTIATRNMGPDWQAELPLLLERELLLAEAVGTPTAILAYAPEMPELHFPGWRGAPLRLLVPRALPGWLPHADGEYSIALTGVA